MRIAIVSPHAPFEGISHAGGLFLYAYVKELSRDNKIDLICLQSPEERALDAFGSSVDVYFCPPGAEGGSSKLRQRTRTLSGFNIGGPEVDALLSDGQARRLLAAADVVDFQWPEVLRAIPPVRRDRGRKPIVVTCHDVYSQALMRLVRAQRDGPDIEQVPLRRQLFAPLAIYTEAYFLNKSDLVQLYKAEDIKALRHAGLRAATALVQPLVQHSPRALGSPDATTMIFVGAFSRPPNAEGARWFMREVLPLVRRSVPAARLVLAGDHSDRVLAECPAPGAHATAYVADLKDHYDAASIAVAPLFRGAGVKVKVPQALAYGLPVVTTAIGAEGLPAGCPAVVTATAGQMAGAIVELLSAPQRVRQLGEEGRAWATRAYDFSSSMKDVQTRFEDLRRGPVPFSPSLHPAR
jgi:glycosyltransferase involved in cell wall biosynthesis